MVAPPKVSELQPNIDPWEQQPFESDKLYTYFNVYKQLGRVRTLAKVAKTLTKNVDYIRQLSAAHHWRPRAEAWDKHEDEQWAKEVIDGRREMAKEHVKLADAMMEKVFEKLNTLNIDEMKASDVNKWAEAATKIKRLGYGEPENTVALTGPGGGPVQIEDLTNMTLQERRQRLLTLRDDLEKRLTGDNDA